MLRNRILMLAMVAGLPAAVSCSGAGAPGSASAGGTVAAETRRAIVPVGAVIELRAGQTISSRDHRPGNLVSATVVSSVLGPTGDVIIPDGAVLYGAIGDIAPAENPGEQGRLRLDFTQARFEGKSWPIRGRVTRMATEMHGRGVTTGDAAKVGVGAVAGGIAGRVIGGNRTGTLVGAAAGAAGGAVYANRTRDIDIVLPRGATLRLTLTQPFRREMASTP